MDTTVKQIGAIVVAELRAAGYMESTIGWYEKSIKMLTGFIEHAEVPIRPRKRQKIQFRV